LPLAITKYFPKVLGIANESSALEKELEEHKAKVVIAKAQACHRINPKPQQ